MLNIPTTHGLALDRTGEYLAAVGPGHGGLFEALSGRQLVSFNAGHAYDVDFAPDAQSVAVCYHGGHLRRYDVATGEVCATYVGHRGVPDGVRKVCFHPDGRLLASVGEDSTLRIWDVKEETQLSRFNARASVNTLAWWPDGEKIVFASDVGLHLVDLDTRKGRSLDTRPIAEVQIRDGLIYTAWGDAIYVLDEQLHCVMELPQRDVSRLRFYEQTLFAASWRGPDQGIVAWDLSTGQRRGALCFDDKVPKVWALALDSTRGRLYGGFTPTNQSVGGVLCWSASTLEPLHP